MRGADVHGPGVRDVRLNPGIRFPALLPPAAAWTSAQLLGARPPSRTSMQAAVAVTTACWLVVLLTGLVLAFA